MSLMKIFSYNYKTYLFVIFIVFSASSTRANIKVIYDAETQNIIYKIADPIFKVAKLKHPKIYIIDDPIPNAFTSGGEILYIHTGLIINFKDPNVLRGVIAHEVGHINARHVSRIQIKAEEQQKIATTSLILGIVGAAITGNPNLAIHGAAVGSHTAERSILKFSRENESAADIKALEYLKNAGYSSDGLITLLEYFRSKHQIPYEARYDITHPISSERISLIKNNHSNILKKDSEELKESYELVVAKLAAFTTNKFDSKKFSLKANKYANAISAMKKSDRIGAMGNIDALIKLDGNNPYFYQLKGEILAAFGDPKALEFYAKAIAISNDELIKVEFALAKIKISNDKELIKSAIATLEISSHELLLNNTVLDYLALGYDKIGNNSYSMYYRALAQKNLGNIKLAKKFAQLAKVNLSSNSPLFLKIDDIIRTSE